MRRVPTWGVSGLSPYYDYVRNAKIKATWIL